MAISNGAKKIGEGYNVEKFVEKPSKERAEKYVQSGEYFWNSGIFLFRAGRYLHELKKFRPHIFDACTESMKTIKADLDFVRVGEPFLVNAQENDELGQNIEKMDLEQNQNAH